MSKVKLTISVADDHMKRFSEVLKAAEKAGMKIDQKHKDLGVATGSIDADKLDSLRNVGGVDHVEQEREVKIAPPESDVQ